MTDPSESDPLLPLLLHHLHAGVVVHSADSRILSANEEACRLLGLAPDQLLGQTATDPSWSFVREDETPLPPAEYPVALVRATCQPVHDLVIGILRSATRDRVWALAHAFPTFSPPGTLDRIVVTFTDITDRIQAEARLRDSELRRDMALDAAQMGTWDWNLETNQITWSAEQEKLFGFPPGTFSGTIRDYLERIHPDDREELRRAGEVARKNRTPIRLETRILWPDGSLHWLATRGQYLFNSAGVPVRVTGVAFDITERKRIENDIRSANAFLDAVIDRSPFPMWVANPDGFVTRTNRALCETLHLDAEKIIGSYNPLMDENLRQQGVLPQVQAVFHQGQPARFSIPWKAADAGRVDFHGALDRHIDVSMFPILDPQGALSCVVCQWVDLTERKQAEEALRLSEERFRTLVDRAPEGIFVQSDGRILYLNPAMVAIFGASRPEDLIGSEFIDQVAPEFQDIVRQRIRLQRETGAPAPPLAEVFLRLDGSRISVETVAVPILFQNRNAHLVFVRDITARLKADAQRETLQTQLQQAQKMDSVGRLAGGVAHDFNNMLGVILGRADLLLGQLDPSLPFFSDLQEIHRAAERSADLTRQLLAFARKQTVAPRILDLNETVEGLLKMLRRLIGENIDLAWHPQSRTLNVKMDPSQLDQILANLCVNARDAIGTAGCITIETDSVDFDEAYCATHPGFTPGAYALLAVSDNGSGMDSETLLHLFEPFFTTKKIGEGTGLGLATVYGIVKQNNGFINVYSEIQQGTTFRIYLPRPPDASRPLPPPATPRPLERGTETILLVEDEPMLLNMTRLMLELAGYHVLAAAGPAEALRSAETHPGEIHLLMTDVVMPEMNGRELAQSLLARYPRLKRLFMSGYTANVIAHHGILDQGVHFIQKPFSASDLATKIRETLGDSPSHLPG